MNVIKDVIFEGEILKMVTDAVAYLDTQTQEKTYLEKIRNYIFHEHVYALFVLKEPRNGLVHR